MGNRYIVEEEADEKERKMEVKHKDIAMVIPLCSVCNHHHEEVPLYSADEELGWSCLYPIGKMGL